MYGTDTIGPHISANPKKEGERRGEREGEREREREREREMELVMHTSQIVYYYIIITFIIITNCNLATLVQTINALVIENHERILFSLPLKFHNWGMHTHTYHLHLPPTHIDTAR